MRGTTRPLKGTLKAVRGCIKHRGWVGPPGFQTQHHAEHSQHACTMRTSLHISLERLKILPRSVRYIAHYAFPVHRHARHTYVVVPTERTLALACSDIGRFDFGAKPSGSGSFVHDLVENTEAFVRARPQHSRIRKLGHPSDLQATMEMVTQHHDTPPTTPLIVHEHESDKVLPGFQTQLVDTPKGPRPLAGGFHKALAHWAPY